jgi:hypothetical protein
VTPEAALWQSEQVSVCPEFSLELTEPDRLDPIAPPGAVQASARASDRVEHCRLIASCQHAQQAPRHGLDLDGTNLDVKRQHLVFIARVQAASPVGDVIGVRAEHDPAVYTPFAIPGSTWHKVGRVVEAERCAG